MGKSSSKSSTAYYNNFNSENWEQVPQKQRLQNYRENADHEPIPHRNKITGEIIDIYHPMFINEEDYEMYLESLNFRKNEPNIVRALYYEPRLRKQFCSTAYGMTVGLEHVKGRLSEYIQIPWRDSLYCMMAMLDGYKKLYDQVGRFYVCQDQVIIDEQGEVRVWVNSDLSRNEPEEPEQALKFHRKSERWDEGQYEMVNDIINMVAQSTDDVDGPKTKFIDYYERERVSYRNKVGFEEAKTLIHDYAQMNRVTVPNVFESVLDIYMQNQNGGYTEDNFVPKHDEGYDELPGEGFSERNYSKMGQGPSDYHAGPKQSAVRAAGTVSRGRDHLVSRPTTFPRNHTNMPIEPQPRRQVTAKPLMFAHPAHFQEPRSSTKNLPSQFHGSFQQVPPLARFNNSLSPQPRFQINQRNSSLNVRVQDRHIVPRQQNRPSVHFMQSQYSKQIAPGRSMATNSFGPPSVAQMQQQPLISNNSAQVQPQTSDPASLQKPFELHQERLNSSESVNEQNVIKQLKQYNRRQELLQKQAKLLSNAEYEPTAVNHARSPSNHHEYEAPNELRSSHGSDQNRNQHQHEQSQQKQSIEHSGDFHQNHQEQMVTPVQGQAGKHMLPAYPINNNTNPYFTPSFQSQPLQNNMFQQRVIIPPRQIMFTNSTSFNYQNTQASQHNTLPRGSRPPKPQPFQPGLNPGIYTGPPKQDFRTWNQNQKPTPAQTTYAVSKMNEKSVKRQINEFYYTIGSQVELDPEIASDLAMLA